MTTRNGAPPSASCTKIVTLLQHELSKRVVLKFTPQLHFHLDEAIERGTKVMEIMRQIDDVVPPAEDDEVRMDEEEPIGNSEELARFEEAEDQEDTPEESKPRRTAMEADPAKPRGRRAEDAARLKDDDDA